MEPLFFSIAMQRYCLFLILQNISVFFLEKHAFFFFFADKTSILPEIQGYCSMKRLFIMYQPNEIPALKRLCDELL